MDDKTRAAGWILLTRVAVEFRRKYALTVNVRAADKLTISCHYESWRDLDGSFKVPVGSTTSYEYSATYQEISDHLREVTRRKAVLFLTEALVSYVDLDLKATAIIDMLSSISSVLMDSKIRPDKDCFCTGLISITGTLLKTGEDGGIGTSDTHTEHIYVNTNRVTAAATAQHLLNTFTDLKRIPKVAAEPKPLVKLQQPLTRVMLDCF